MDCRCPNCSSVPLRRLEYPEGSILICGACRLQWAQLSVSIAGPTHTYYMQPESVGDTSTYAPYCEFFAFLGQRMGARRLTILDVGCGTGSFIRECLRRGHDAYGIEKELGLGRRMAPEVSPRVVFAGAGEALPDSREYDVITFWDSFEHMEDAFSILRILARRLGKHGLVYLRVNNSHDIYNLVANLAVRALPPLGRPLFKACFNLPQHVWNFNQAALTQMLARHGFVVVRYAIGETPAARLSKNPLVQRLMGGAYAINRIMGGGKIANVYLQPVREDQ